MSTCRSVIPKAIILTHEARSNIQQMLTHFLGKICFLDVDKAWDGQQCLDKVFSQNPLYYQVIIVSHHAFV